MSGVRDITKRSGATASFSSRLNANLGIAAASLIVITFTALWFLFMDAGAVNAKACDDDNMCTNDFAIGLPVSCEHRPASKSATCSDACYVTGKCDGQGHCANADARQCKGWCDSDNDDTCDNLFVFSEGLSEWAYPGPGSSGTTCFVNRCGAWLVYIATVDGAYPGPQASLTCWDMLDPTFLAANRSCIEMHEWLLESDWGADLGFAFFEYHRCQFHWQCAPLNNTALSLLLSSTSARADAVQALANASAAQRPANGTTATILDLWRPRR
jgi:hypothetical protein